MSKIFKKYWDVLLFIVLVLGFTFFVLSIYLTNKELEKARCENLKENNITSSECKGVM